MKTKIAIVLFGALAVVGCGKEIVYKDRIQEVPVLVFDDPPSPAKLEEMPDLPIFSITKDSSREEIARAFAETVTILRSRVSEQEAALEPFRKNGTKHAD